jgi:hypothetical protein
MKPGAISRRSAAAVLAAAIAWPRGAVAQECPMSTQAIMQILVAIVSEPCTALTIGHLCLNSLDAAEFNPEVLAKTIANHSGCNGLRSEQDIRRRISSHVRHEFTEGIVLNVDGWILSRTETRLYALAALARTGA